jgi:ferredoxin
MPDYHIDFEPVGRRITVPTGQTLLDAAQAAGVALIAVCGGAGLCEECRIRLALGKLTPPTLVELKTFSEAELDNGMRLASTPQ